MLHTSHLSYNRFKHNKIFVIQAPRDLRISTLSMHDGPSKSSAIKNGMSALPGPDGALLVQPLRVALMRIINCTEKSNDTGECGAKSAIRIISPRKQAKRPKGNAEEGNSGWNVLPPLTSTHCGVLAISCHLRLGLGNVVKLSPTAGHWSALFPSIVLGSGHQVKARGRRALGAALRSLFEQRVQTELLIVARLRF